MASAWGSSWGTSWGNAWGDVGATAAVAPPAYGKHRDKHAKVDDYQSWAEYLDAVNRRQKRQEPAPVTPAPITSATPTSITEAPDDYDEAMAARMAEFMILQAEGLANVDAAMAARWEEEFVVLLLAAA